MTALLFLLPIVASAIVKGIPPSKQSLYEPNSLGQWSCLNNPEIVLSSDQINDDYCDCPDGSDEPGTAACPGSEFYCANEGYEPSFIKSYLVNDGACDYEVCCDGSDEWATGVVCPNRCEEMRLLKLQRQEDKLKEMESGLKALRVLKERAAIERSKLTNELEVKSKELEGISGKLEQLRNDPEYLQLSKQKEEEGRINDVLKLTQQDIQSKFAIFIAAKDYHTKLVEILKNLQETFNENINDAAVSKTIKDFQIHLDTYKGEYDADVNDPQAHPNKSLKKAQKILRSDFKSIVKNYQSLQNLCTHTLSKHDDLIKRTSELEGILGYFIHNYNPNFNDLNVKNAVNAFQDLSVNKASTNGEVGYSFIDDLFQNHLEIVRYVEDSHSPDSESVQYEAVEPLLTFKQKIQYHFRKLVNDFIGQEYNSNPIPIPDNYIAPSSKADQINNQITQLVKSQSQIANQISNIQSQLSTNHGPNDILRIPQTIKDTIGEYEYILELPGSITQRSKQSSVNIGKYQSLTVDEISDLEYQLRLQYDQGAKCWNGPIRKATVVVQCGEHNEIISVGELEKCQYEFKVKSPLGCKWIE